jgi:hypothetical protein
LQKKDLKVRQKRRFQADKVRRAMYADSAGRARNIIDAWERKDLDGLRAQLTLPHDPSVSSEEQERMDLLAGIAQQMRQGLPPDQSEVCFRLLEHLAFSGTHPPIRARKVAFFPC